MIASWEGISMPDHCPPIFAGLDRSFFPLFSRKMWCSRPISQGSGIDTRKMMMKYKCGEVVKGHNAV